MNLSPKDVMVFIDPPYCIFYNNELFKVTSKWNRNGVFAPLILLKERLARKGIPVSTADYLLNRQITGKVNIYVSLGITANYRKWAKRNDVLLQSFYILEAPIVGPHLYRELSHLAEYFPRVYAYNTEGVGYERYFSNQSNLRKFFFWPHAEDGIIEHLWNNKDRDFLTMINSNKTAPSSFLVLRRGRNLMSLRVIFNRSPRDRELYSERIRALVALQSLGSVDLYGYGWDASLYQILRNMPKSQTFPYMYWKHRKALRAIYKGSVKSKHETLSQYKFALCFENMVMPGYITEKIFDCLFVGTIPIYLGAPDVERYIPKNCFIDMRDFDSYGELHAYLLGLSDEDISSFREAAREYLSSEQYQPFTKESFVEQLEIDLMQTLQENGINLPSLQNANSTTGYPKVTNV